MRIGQGYDVHCLRDNRRLVLGGVHIPSEKGLDGHSDADVLVHAIIDALLGAAAMGDIGKMFPDSDDSFKDADSLRLLSIVSKCLYDSGYKISNVDSTIIAQYPKLSPYIGEMRRRIAKAAGINIDQVSVKATTEEHLGFTGNGEGIAAQAVALIEN